MKKYTLLIVIISTGFPLLADSFEDKLVSAAKGRTLESVRYDGAYISIDYPNGDVPKNIGVCTRSVPFRLGTFSMVFWLVTKVQKPTSNHSKQDVFPLMSTSFF